MPPGSRTSPRPLQTISALGWLYDDPSKRGKKADGERLIGSGAADSLPPDCGPRKLCYIQGKDQERAHARTLRIKAANLPRCSSNPTMHRTDKNEKPAKIFLPFISLNPSVARTDKFNTRTHLSSAMESKESTTDSAFTVTVPVFLTVMLYSIKSPGLVPASPSLSLRVVLTIKDSPDDRKRVVEAKAVAPVVPPNGALAETLQDDAGIYVQI